MELKGKLTGANGRRMRFTGFTASLSFARTGDDEIGRSLASKVIEATATATGLLTFDLPEEVLRAQSPDMLLNFVARDADGVDRGRTRIKRDELVPLIRAQTPVEIEVAEARDPEPQPEPRGTPVVLRGRVEIEGQPAQIDGFDGYRVEAAFSRSDATGEGTGGVELADGHMFAIALPDKEKLADAPVKLTARYPDGRIAGGTTVAFADLAKEAIIKIPAATVPTLTTDPRAEAARPEKLKGKVIQFDGAAVRNRQVAFWAIADGSQPSVFLVTQTDSLGGFSADRPKQEFAGVIATVSGTANSRPEHAVTVALEGGTGESGGRLPPFVYLVVDAVDGGADDEDCECGVGAPRLPDQDELVAATGAYSQDIGGSCTNFTIPNRTLEEFTYSMAVRTSEPLVKGTTLSNIEQRDQLWHNRIADLFAGDEATDRSANRSTTALPMTMARDTSLATLSAFKWNFGAAFQVDPGLFQMFNGRGQLNAGNAVDWDSEPTFYQATTIAHGHILYFKQVWKADGYSLGDLLYSLPLAPGQKKQIVVFDWDRTEYGRRDEASHADESLDAYLSHNRDILDITQGSVSEQMRGGSRSKTSGEAGGIGAGIGALLGPVFIGVAGGYSASSGSASASAWQDSSRNTSATGLSQLRDNIQQGASSVRNQRATVVQTARQAEQFRVETEVVANHNHCHAITIQYFEVLRHYVIEQKLSHVQECLFVPLLMSPFTEEKVIRWMDILRATLRDPGSRSVHRLATGGISYRKKPLAEAFSAIERRLAPPNSQQQPATTFAAEKVLDLSGDLYLELELNRPEDKEGDEEEVDKLLDEQRWNIFLMYLPYGMNELRTKLEKRVRADRDKIFQEEIAPEIAQRFVAGLKFAAIDRDGNRHDLDLDATLVSRYARSTPQYISIRPNMSELPVTREQIAKFVIFSTHDITQAARSRVVVRRAMLRYRTQHYDGTLIRNDAVNNDLKSATIDFGGGNIIPSDNVVLFTPLSSDEMRNPKKEDEELVRRLLVHLNGSLEYYHRMIWQRMDAQRRFMLLDGFIAPHSGGKSVASVVENRVIGIAGNSLIMPVAPGYKLDPSFDPEPQLDDQGNPVLGADGKPLMMPVDLLGHYEPTTPIPPYRISVPTRGVFAEAVMGACNSCEKKDDSRFWRWEESPNPDEPTSINPIGTNPPVRSDPGNLNPTPFPAPIIAMQNAPAAPNPGATLEATMALLGKSGLFPDITGLSETQKNALQAMLSNQESAKHFADKAAELATLASAQRGTDGTIDTIKKAQADNLLDEGTAKKLTEESIRAKINGKTKEEEPDNTAKDSDVGKAAAKAVDEGRPVNVTQSHPDGTSTVFEGLSDTLGGDKTARKGSPWKHLVKADVLADINAIATAPDTLKQGALGLCGEAAFLRHVAKRRPTRWSMFAKTLYVHGSADMSSLEVEAGSDLLAADYPALVKKHSNMPSPAVWMAMSALRDSENLVLDFEGSPEESFSEGSSKGEKEDWYQDCGIWSSVTIEDDTDAIGPVVAAGALTADKDIILSIDVEMIDSTLSGRHVIALESPIVHDAATGKVSFTYWTWGTSGNAYSQPVADFLDKLNYVLTAKI